MPSPGHETNRTVVSYRWVNRLNDREAPFSTGYPIIGLTPDFPSFRAKSGHAQLCLREIGYLHNCACVVNYNYANTCMVPDTAGTGDEVEYQCLLAVA